jgi:peptidoglycan/xylan/chitin deacetylase (PgdA/CDA1 family)
MRHSSAPIAATIVESGMARNPARCNVALTFDFDAESLWLGSFGVDTPSALSRGAYGAYEGVPRILRLLEKFGLPATFFVTGDTADRHPDVVKCIVDAGHEIGHHGYLHEPPHLLAPDEERAILERGLAALAKHGVKPAGYRSPSWELSQTTYPLLEEYGFTYDSSMLARDTPYWVTIGDRRTEIVEVPSAWELTDSAHFFFVAVPKHIVGLSAPSKVEEIWRGDFDGAYADGGLFVLTMHPQIIGRHHRMRLLERMIRYVQEHDGVRFVQMHEIADEFRVQQGA